MSTYGDCVYCGGAVSERQERLDYRYHGQLFIMEHVPVGVCNQCGEKFLNAVVTKRLEGAAAQCDHPVRTLAVPIISLAA